MVWGDQAEDSFSERTKKVHFEEQVCKAML
jgi:hypothetical protein